MRLASDDEKDPGYPACRALLDSGRFAHVFLDGEKVENCSLADDVLGYVERLAIERDGEVIGVDGSGKAFAIARLYGDVKIVISDSPQ